MRMSGTVVDAPAGGPAASARRAGAPEKRWVALVAIALLVAAEFATVSLLVMNRPLLTPVRHGPLSSYQATPLAGHLPTLHYSSHTLRIVFLLLIALMFALYLVAIRNAESLRLRTVAATIAGAQVIALLGPLVVTDVYNYIDFARLEVVHHLNPYTAPPAAAPHDPVYPLTPWILQPTSYGPLFTIGTFPLALLQPSHAIWATKIAAYLTSAGCITLVYLCALKLRRPARMCALAVGLNPLVLIYALGGAHNDFLMMVLVLAGVLLVLGGRGTWGVAPMVAAVGVKASAAPVLLFALIRERRLRPLLVAVAAAAALGLLTVALFGVHAPGFSAQSKAWTPLSLPDLVARALGVSARQDCSIVYNCARPGVRAVSTAVLVAGTVTLVWRAWRGADWITSSGWMMVLLIGTLTSVMPWYMLWVLPFAVLSRSRALHIATAAVAVLLVVGSVPATYLLLPHWH